MTHIPYWAKLARCRECNEPATMGEYCDDCAPDEAPKASSKPFHLERALEALVDKEGLAIVLEALAAICSDKAVHMAENWQDSTTAKAWIRAERICNRAAQDTSALGLS